ncbi:MAG: DUF2125 domain-containing protein [Alphaproteobacteria bacterium]
MPDQQTNRQRKSGLRRLAVPAVLLIAAWSTIWIIAAWQTNRWLNDALDDWALAGNRVACDNRATGGYPASLRLHCTGFEVGGANAGLALTLSSLGTRTSIWHPGVITTNPATPASVQITGASVPIALDWSGAEFSTRLGLSGYTGSDLTAEQIQARWQAGLLAAAAFHATFGAAADPAQTELTLVADDIEIRISGTALGPAGLQARVRLDTSLDDIRSGRIEPTVAPVRLSLVEISLQIAGATLEGLGSLTIDTAGYLDGDLVLFVQNLPALSGLIATLPPEAALVAGPLVGAIVALAGEGMRNGRAARTLQLTIRGGILRAGPFQIARIPPLYPS